MILSLPPSPAATWPFLPPEPDHVGLLGADEVGRLPAHGGAFLPLPPGAASAVAAIQASATVAAMVVPARTRRSYVSAARSPCSVGRMELGFAEVLLFGGGLLAVAAALSGLFQGTVLSISVLGVPRASAWRRRRGRVEPDDETVIQLIELALIMTLFSDGLFVQRELLVVHWSPPVRALALAMPMTLLFLAVAAKGLFGTSSWAEAFLLAAVLSPTDPVVTSTVVTSQSVPE